MELQDWRKEPRKNYSNEFKLRMVELASQPGACVAQIARENGVNDNVIFKWLRLRLWQNEGRVSRRLPVSSVRFMKVVRMRGKMLSRILRTVLQIRDSRDYRRGNGLPAPQRDIFF